MKRLYKRALIDLEAEDMRQKENKDFDKKELSDTELDFLDDVDTEHAKDKTPEKSTTENQKPSKEYEVGTENKKDQKPKFEQPQVTTDDVNNQFEVKDQGMGIEMISLDQGLLNDLSSLQVLYQQTKLFHWIFNGENYIATHRFLDEVAEAILEQIDLFAERLVFLNIDPVADMNVISTLSYIDFVQMNQNFKFTSLMNILDDGLSKIINSMKDNSIRASDSKDIGTSKLLEDFIYDLEVLQHHIRSFK